MVKRIRTDAEKAKIDRVMNDHVKGERVIAHCVPTRAIRVVILETEKTFRVQQLNPNTHTWTTLSTHTGDEPWESWEPAITDALEKQEQLRLALTRMKIEAKNAEAMMNAARSVARGTPLPKQSPELIFDND